MWEPASSLPATAVREFEEGVLSNAVKATEKHYGCETSTITIRDTGLANNSVLGTISMLKVYLHTCVHYGLIKPVVAHIAEFLIDLTDFFLNAHESKCSVLGLNGSFIRNVH